MHYKALTVFWLLISMSVAQAQDNELQPVTASNIDRLTSMQVLDDTCIGFDKDESIIVTSSGLFDLTSGEPRIDSEFVNLSADPEWSPFSPNEQWIISVDGIYAAATGERVFPLADSQVFIAFSEDGSLMHIDGITYSTETWEQVDPILIADFEFFVDLESNRYIWRDFTSGNGIPTYLSSQGNYWVHVVDGMYRTDTGEKIDLPTPLQNPVVLESGVFSPNDLIFFVYDDTRGLTTAYRTQSFEKAYELPVTIGRQGRLSVPFSADGLFFGVTGDAVYQAYTGERLLEVLGTPVFGDKLVAVYPGGVFELFSGEKRFDVPQNVGEMRFSADSSLLYAGTNIPEILIYDVQTGEIVQSLNGNVLTISPQEHFLALTNVSNDCELYGINAQ